MPRSRLPHLHKQVNRHGKIVWYHRIGHGVRTRITAPHGTEQFQAEYDAAESGKPLVRRGPASGSLRWLWDKYRLESDEWVNRLKPATKRQRENIMLHVLAAAGEDPFVDIDEATIEKGKVRRVGTPAQARNFLDTMRGLFRWAKAAGHVKVDPTANVKNPKRPEGPGFEAWTEADAEAYEARWPVGTRQRVWLDVLLYTGLRRGDAVLLGKQHVRNGVAVLKTEKSGETVTVTLPILPVLQRTLDAGPTGDLSFICGERGHPLTKESFGNFFSAAARQAGVNKSAHGVRKIAATRAAENGATTSQLKAIFGWTDDAMPSLYTKEADRKRMSMQAMPLLENAERTSIPSPVKKVGD